MQTKQTAVEWLIEEMILRLTIRIENVTNGVELLEQAKAMEKEQITDAYLKLMCDEYGYEVAPQSWILMAEEYYNENYGTPVDKKG